MSLNWIHRVLNKSDVKRRLAKQPVRPALETLEARDVPTTYDIGFGQAFTSVGAVPWNNITAGDTVRIHWRSGAQGGDYHEKINISGQGTAANPIQILGVPGPNGERPVINGANATTGPNNTTGYLGHQTRGLITFSRSSNNQDFNYYKPQFIVIDGLEVENARPQFTFTNSAGVVVPYAQNAAAIYIERGSNITIRNTEIHHSGNGFFAGSNDYATNGGDGGMIRDVLFERNYVHDNGTPGGYSEHNIYTEGVNFTFQYNRLGPLTATSAGANLKDRSAGTIIRYNYVEGGAHLLDLVHAQESASITTQLPSYRQTYVYGNILRDGPGPTGTMIHYGGDDYGNQQDFRKGTLHFYNNTVIVQNNQFGPGGAYQTVVFQLATNDEAADVRNNVFYRSAAVGAPPGTAPTLLAFAANGDNAGQYHMGVNWASPDWHAWYNDQAPAGGLFEGAANLITNAANNPGFVNLATYDLHLTPNSPLIDRGQALAPGTASQPVTRQYVVHQNSEPRTVNGLASDLGAFEADGVAATLPGQFQFTASSYSVNEGAGTITIGVARTGGSDGAVSVNYTSSNGTAVAGQDYAATSGILTWAAGDSTVKTFTVAVLDDTAVESNESALVSLTNPTGGATLANSASATLTIVDIDVAPTPTFGRLQFSASNYTVNEAAGTVTIGVMRTGGSDGAVSVNYATANGTAAASDYAATSGTLTWAAGDSSVKSFTVSIIDDSLVEANETILVALTNPTGGATLGNPGGATLTIGDNDVAQGGGQFRFSASGYSVNENAGPVTITVTRTGGSAGTATVRFATYDRAGDPNVAWGLSDYVPTSGTLSFAPGETSKTFTISLIDDNSVEANENIGIALSNPSGGATVGTPTATVSIVENDSSVHFSKPRFDVTEGAQFATISVTRKGNASGRATVNYSMQSETAYAGQDFVSASGQLVFAPGETVKTFTIRILDDLVKERTEQLALQLSSPTGGAILGENIWARLFIADNDAQSPLPLTPFVKEGDALFGDIDPLTGRRRR